MRSFWTTQAASSRRVAAAKERAVAEREDRVARALRARKQIAAPAREKEQRKESAKNARASTTDPDARLMKMADGGFRPAYNGQFAPPTRSRG